MMAHDDALQRAIEALAIRSVDLADLRTQMAREVRLAAPDPDSLLMQGRHGVSNAQWVEVSPGAVDSDKALLLLCRVSVGLRVVHRDRSDPEDDSLLLVEAEFDAEYGADERIDDADVEAFTKHNVVYHVWPYWRELVQSIVSRTRFPAPVTVPHYLAASRRRREKSDESNPEPSDPIAR